MSKKIGLTGQGVRDLDHGFGPPSKRNEYPDDCTLGLHAWTEWEIGGGYAVRYCVDCEEPEYKNMAPKMHNTPFSNLNTTKAA